MSALGQKQTRAMQQRMSVLPLMIRTHANAHVCFAPKADMCGALTYVCFGPADAAVQLESKGEKPTWGICVATDLRSA
jgi:hypothetical protein